MEGIADDKDSVVFAIARFIDDHKGKNTVILRLGTRCSFTDYFIISTVSSEGHLRGLFNNLNTYLKDHQLELLNKKKNLDDIGWQLLDCGSFVIHLMTEEKRSFYDLERLWFESERLSHSSSSKSS